MKRRRSLLLSVIVFVVCNANSVFGSTNRSCRQVLHASTPVTVSVQVDNASLVHISIDVSGIEDDIMGYKVYFTRDDEQSDESFVDWQQIHVQSSDRSYTLKMDEETLHLKPNIRYRLRVTTSTSNGETEPSEVVEFKTSNTVSQAPSNVNVVIAASNSFTVYFDAAIDPNSTDIQSKYVNEYTIEFTPDNPLSPDAVWKSFNFLVDGLSDETKRISKSFSSEYVKPSTNYSLRVLTYGRSDGIASHLVSFETKTGAYSPVVSIVGPSVLEMDPSLMKGYKLKCEAVADPPASINWLINETLITNDTDEFLIHERIEQLTTQSEIHIAKRTQSEVFICNGSNPVGSSQASVEVRILGPGSAPTDIVATLDSLGLHVSWNPPSITNGQIKNYIVYWTADEHKELAHWKQVLVTGNQLRTTIAVDNETDTFFIRVQSSSVNGAGIVSDTVTSKPSITEIPLQTAIILMNQNMSSTYNDSTVVMVEAGEDIEFKCLTMGRPAPNISFYWITEHELQQSNKSKPKSMLFRNVPPNTIESYEVTTRTYSNRYLVCRGENSREMNEAKIFFDVKTIHSNSTKPVIAPKNLRTQQMDNDDLVLLWDEVHFDDDTDVLHYNIYLSDNLTKPIRKWTLLSTNQTTFNLTKQFTRPASNYYVRISAVSNYGEGMLSSPVSFSTPTGAPRGPPQNVRIGVDEANVVIVDWNRPINTNGLLIKYTIYFTRDAGMADEDFKNWQSVDVTTSEEHYRYKMEQHKVGLRPKTLYRMRITAKNQIAESEPTEVLEFETTQGEFPVPTDVQVEVLKDNTVIVTFTAVKDPEDHSIYIQDYDVFLSASTDALVAQFFHVTIAEKTFDPNNAQITMKIAPKELNTMTQYWAKVQARIPNRQIQASKPKRFQTGDGKFPPIVRIRQGDRIKREPSRTMRLHLECDADGHPRPIISWLWNGQRIEENNHYWKITDITTDPVRNMHKVSSRLAASNVSRSGMISCEAINNKGYAVINTSIVVTGPGSAVRNVRIIPNQNMLNICWQEPEITNGKIHHYLIYMTTSPSHDLNEWQKIEVIAEKKCIIIDKVEPNTNYTFKFQSASEFGYGLISDAFTVNSGKLYIPLDVHIKLIDFESHNSTEYTVEPGTTIRFHCIARGNPQPSIVHFWTTEGIQDEEFGTDAVFFAKLNQLDKYTVDSVESVTSTHTTRDLVCEARNEHGHVQHRIRFNVYKPGSAPRCIQYVVSPSNQITISWKKPSLPNGIITSYLAYITQKRSNSLRDWRRIVIDSNRRRFSFVEGELEFNSTYFLRMTSANEYGEGVLSDVVEIRTHNGGPLEAPEDVNVDVDEVNTLTVSWLLPKIANGEIKGYIFYFTRSVRYSEYEYRKWQSVEITNISPLIDQYILNGKSIGLRRDLNYRLRMSAWNGIGEGPVSEVTYFKTRSGLFKAPEDIKVRTDQNGDVLVQFNAVHDRRNARNITLVTTYTILITTLPIEEYAKWQSIEFEQTPNNQTITVSLRKAFFKAGKRCAMKVVARDGSKLGDESTPMDVDLYSDSLLHKFRKSKQHPS